MESCLHDSSVPREVHARHDVKVIDKDDFLSRCTLIKAKSTVMKERLWINRVCVSAFHPDIGAPFHEEHVTAVRKEPNFHLEFYQPDVPMECGHPGTSLLTWQRVFRRWSKFHRTSRTQCSLLFIFPCCAHVLTLALTFFFLVERGEHGGGRGG